MKAGPLLFSSLAPFVFAHAWIDGTWTGTIRENGAVQEIRIVIDGESNDLFGTVSGASWKATFKNGNFDDRESVSFTAHETHHKEDVWVLYDGSIRPGRIDFVRYIPGSVPIRFTVRR
jgi:hypothetical protein